MSLGTLSNVNVDVTDIKMATGSWYCLSFTALIRQIRTAGVKTKALKFTAWDRSFPFISETSNLRLLFMTSRTSALSLLQLATFDCEQSPFSQSSQGSAKLPRGELERQREAPPQFPLGWPCVFFFFRSHRSISSLARPPWGTARSLMWLKRSKLPYLPWLRFLNPFCFFQWIRVCSWWRTSNRRLGPGSARHVRRWAPWTRCSASVRIWGIPRGR